MTDSEEPEPSVATTRTPRRTALVGMLAALTSAMTPAAHATSGGRPAPDGRSPDGHAPDRYAPDRDASDRYAEYHAWTTAADWRSGTADGTRPADGDLSGLAIGEPAGTYDYQDPHTGRSTSWEYATWTSPVYTPGRPAGEAVASWNADTPAGSWLAVELCGTYTDGTATPWYVMGRWASEDTDLRRTSVDGQGDGRSAVATDTLAVTDLSSGLRLAAYQLRLTLHRSPGTDLTPTVRRAGVLTSDLPDRFTVPASAPGVGRGRELPVPRYSQEIHQGQYPEYDNGGEAWCSPTSSQMVIEYWGRRPSPPDLAWVDPAYADPQVCQAARATYDYQYQGCGNWPFNAAYAATYPGLEAVVTRLASLTDVEHLIAAGIPVITSQSFLNGELTGAGYGTAGHLMAVVGFTGAGDVIANDPNSPADQVVRRIYRRREFENIWLRSRRNDSDGKPLPATGGVCYLYFPTDLTPAQRQALASAGVR